MPTFVGLRAAPLSPTLSEDRSRLGGRCQWVLDAICEIVEWLSQPLRFESVVLRTALDVSNSRNRVAPVL